MIETVFLGSAVPAVIGKAGKQLKDFEKDLHVKLNVKSDTQELQIVGKPLLVKDAVQTIGAFIEPMLD